MDIGFQTIGNATLLVYDKGPVLACDPWIQGAAYFGSWALSHEIPEAQRQAVIDSPYLFFSHGHPDHLNQECLPLFTGKTILLADHVGKRISNDLTAMGFKVKTLKDRQWYRISDRIRIFTIADHLQDSIILVDCDGELIINLNDTAQHGWQRTVKREAKSFDRKFLLSISGYGDVDMINFFDEAGRYILPNAAKRDPVGVSVAQAVEDFNATCFVPFSSFHHYQRKDSIWANQYTTEVDAYARGFYLPQEKLLKPFQSYDRVAGVFTTIDAKKNPQAVFEPTVFGDNWSDELTPEDMSKVKAYFSAVEHLRLTLGFINLRVGGKDNVIFLGGNPKKGVTFEVPRGSLMTCVEYKIFDDLLIGNFMKTTLHGDWPATKLYPDFTPYLCKYADNAHAYTDKAVADYLALYDSRSLDLRLFRWGQELKAQWQNRLPQGSAAYKVGKGMYRLLRKFAALS